MELKKMFMGSLNKKTQKYTHPFYASKEETYECLDCGEDLILCQGKIRHSYFRHKINTQCAYYNHPGEGQIHKEAKRQLKYILENYGLKIIRNCDICSQELVFNIECCVSNGVKLEHRFKYGKKDRIADVICFNELQNLQDSQDSQDEDIKYIFEVYNSNKTQEEARPEPWFEIQATEILEAMKTKDFVFTCLRETKIGCACSTYFCSRCGVETPLFISETNIDKELCKICDITRPDKNNFVYLNVPYTQKDEAKNLGAKWNYSVKKWYCSEEHIRQFLKWL